MTFCILCLIGFAYCLWFHILLNVVIVGCILSHWCYQFQYWYCLILFSKWIFPKFLIHLWFFQQSGKYIFSPIHRWSCIFKWKGCFSYSIVVFKHILVVFIIFHSFIVPETFYLSNNLIYLLLLKLPFTLINRRWCYNW